MPPTQSAPTLYDHQLDHSLLSDSLTHSLTDSLTDSLVYMNLKILLQPGVHSVTSCVEFGASNVTISYETDLTH